MGCVALLLGRRADETSQSREIWVEKEHVALSQIAIFLASLIRKPLIVIEDRFSVVLREKSDLFSMSSGAVKARVCSNSPFSRKFSKNMSTSLEKELSFVLAFDKVPLGTKDKQYVIWLAKTTFDLTAFFSASRLHGGDFPVSARLLSKKCRLVSEPARKSSLLSIFLPQLV